MGHGLLVTAEPIGAISKSACGGGDASTRPARGECKQLGSPNSEFAPHPKD